MNFKAFGGWKRVAFIESGPVTIGITAEVGPRILYCAHEGGPNLLRCYEKHAGLTGGSEYRSYGGHRIWLSPELPDFTEMVDNEPPTISGNRFTPKPDQLGLVRHLEATPMDGGIRIDHIFENMGTNEVEFAPWTITVMNSGGKLFVPLHEEPETPGKLPAQPLVQWEYTHLFDPRYMIHEGFMTLDQTKGTKPTKFGLLVPQGWAAYVNEGYAFILRFDYQQPDAFGKPAYPDFGVNFESYSRHDMLEVETLGPFVTLGPGENTVHTENWCVHKIQESNDQEVFEKLRKLTANCP